MVSRLCVQVLATTPAPDEIVIMNNLATHKVTGIREAVDARSAANAAISAVCSAKTMPPAEDQSTPEVLLHMRKVTDRLGRYWDLPSRAN